MEVILGLKSLPFEQSKKQVIYVEGKYDVDVNAYIQRNYDHIQAEFQKHGYEFVYMPRLVEEILQNDVMAYNAPYADGFESELTFKNDFLLNYMVHQENRDKVPPALLHYDPDLKDDSYPEGTRFFRGVAITPDSHYKSTDNLSNLIKDIIGIEDFMWTDFLSKIKFGKSIIEDEDEIDRSCMSVSEPALTIDDLDDYDSETLKMMDQFATLANKLKLSGVKEYALMKLVRGEEKLSRLRITKDFRFFLMDYRDIEIVMTPLHKALYLLYLNHPEGISFYDIVDYRDELLEFYKSVKGGMFNWLNARDSIIALTNRTGNSLNEKIARIKSAFTAKMKDPVAKNYYIEGPKGGKKRISLPREMVVWDH